jgi:hypothetical protein
VRDETFKTVRAREWSIQVWETGGAENMIYK